MNKKNIIVVSILVILVVGGIIFYFLKSPQLNTNNYESNKVSTTQNDNSNTSNNTNSAEENTTTDKTLQPAVTEEELTAFSTKIYTKDSGRQNNINITCDRLNNTIVKNGETFSFCSTLGPSTSNKGYQEADIFDSNGKKKKGLGGGNCQVSTTLYNAVLQVSSLEVAERHPHSNYVPYIQKGKDAAVAYGSYDLKFKNNTGNDLKILAETSQDNVTIKLISLK